MKKKLKIEVKNKTEAEMKTYRTYIEPFLGSALFDKIDQMDFPDDYVELVITGVPTKDGKPIWKSVDDLMSSPYSHGFLEAIGAVTQIIKSVQLYLFSAQDDVPELRIRFVAKIRDVFSQNKGWKNPLAWIHIGHGQKCFDYKLLDDLEDWEPEEYDEIPGISDGHEDEDFISSEWLSDAIKMMQGELLFVGLPLCFSAQIGEVLMQSGKIVKIHSPYDFKVSESLEFYDARNGRILPEHTLTDWTDYVRVFEKGLAPALVRVYREKFPQIPENDEVKSKEAVR